MEKVKVYIKGQEDKELYSFLRYYPMRIKNIGIEDIFSRQMVYDFKSGLLQQSIAKCVAKELVKTYGRKVKNRTPSRWMGHSSMVRMCVYGMTSLPRAPHSAISPLSLKRSERT